MQCRELMTSDPSCCLPGDSVAVAAQIMKRQNIGSVLVVSNHSDRRLLGILTDRDLVVKVVAEERDPHTTRLDEVMSPIPVVCREGEDISEAMDAMAYHQVRRIPVVDADGRLTGIIAQADLTRAAHEEDVAEMLEEISQPYGRDDWPEPREGASTRAIAIIVGAACFGMGAALLYRIRKNSRAAGDHALERRVHAKLGRRHKGVQVRAEAGHVTLTGRVGAADVRELIAKVRSINGVHSVENLLEVNAAKPPKPNGRVREPVRAAPAPPERSSR